MAYQSRLEIVVDSRTGERNLRRVRGELNRTERQGASLTGTLKRALIPLTSLVSATAGLSKLTSVAREFDVLNASLVTATGSAEGAATAFDAIRNFASETPYSLQEVTGAFIRLKNLGLDPSEAALVSYGNTAAAMGKTLNQTVEAVADAATGEFERLKEFGIRAKSQGDQVTFTFQGVSTTVKKEAAAIEEYIRNIGDVNFAGAMTERVQTLDGALSNLGDSWDNLFLTISQQGAGDLIEDSVRAAEMAISDLTDMLASGQLQGYFNAFTGKFDGMTEDIIRSIDIVNDLIEQSAIDWTDVGGDAAEFIGDAFTNLPENVRAFVQIATVEIAALVDKAAAYGQSIADSLDPRTWFSDDDDAAARLEARLNGIESARLSSIETILNERDASVEAFEAEIDAADRARKAYELAKVARAARPDPLAQFGGGGYTSPVSATDRDAQAKLEQDLAKRLETLRQSFETEKQVIQRAFKEREEEIKALEEAGLMSEMETQNMRLQNEQEMFSKLKAMREQDLEDQRQLEAQRQMLILGGSEQLFGSLAEMTSQFAGEQNALYKTLFAFQKAASIAQSIVAINTGIAQAAALPFPANLGAMATVAGATAGIIGNIQAVTLTGMAHDGLDSVPQTGTWLLEKGERVLTSETSAKLDAILSRIGQGGSGTVVNVNNAPAGTRTEESTDSQGNRVIDIFIADMSTGGPMSRTIQSTYGLKRQGR